MDCLRIYDFSLHFWHEEFSEDPDNDPEGIPGNKAVEIVTRVPCNEQENIIGNIHKVAQELMSLPDALYLEEIHFPTASHVVGDYSKQDLDED